MNLVKLSGLLEVSRSAVTQSVRRLIKKNLVSFEFAQDNEKNKYLILSKKGVEVFNIHKEQQEHIEKAIFSILRNYSEEDLQMVMKLHDVLNRCGENYRGKNHGNFKTILLIILTKRGRYEYAN